MDLTNAFPLVAICSFSLVIAWFVFGILKTPITLGTSTREDAYWVHYSLIRDCDGKVLAQIVARQGMMWGYHTGVTENDVVFGYVSEQYAKRAAENKCKVNVIQKKEGF